MGKSSKWSSVTTLKGMSLQDQKKFSYENLKHYFRVLLYDVKPYCAGCGEKINSIRQASLDHIVPRSKGGRTRLSNLQIMHPECNVRKSNQMPARIPYKAFTPVDSRRGQKTKYDKLKGFSPKVRTVYAKKPPVKEKNL